MTTLHDLRIEAAAAAAAIANFSDILGDDESARADFVEGETSLSEVMEFMANRLGTIDALAGGIDAQVKKLQERKKRLTKQGDNIRAAMLLALQTVEVPRVETAVATISLVKAKRKPEVVNETLLPSDYEKTSVAVDKKKINDRVAELIKEHGSYDEIPTQLLIPGVEYMLGDDTVMVTRG